MTTSNDTKTLAPLSLNAQFYAMAYGLGAEGGEAKVREYTTLMSATDEVADLTVKAFHAQREADDKAKAVETFSNSLDFSLSDEADFDTEDLQVALAKAHEMGILDRLHFVRSLVVDSETGEEGEEGIETFTLVLRKTSAPKAAGGGTTRKGGSRSRKTYRVNGAEVNLRKWAEDNLTGDDRQALTLCEEGGAHKVDPTRWSEGTKFSLYPALKALKLVEKYGVTVDD